MNRTYLILIAGLLVMQACGGVKRVEKKPQLTTTPQKLELAVDQGAEVYTIPVNYTLNIPRGYVPSCARLIYAPRFVAPGNEYALVPVVVVGKNYNRLDERLQLLDGKLPDYPGAIYLVAEGDSMNVNVSQQVPFQTWMPQAKLIADVTLEACDRETLLYQQTLADGVFYMPQGPGPVLVKYVRKEVVKQKESIIRFHYPVNGYTVDSGLYNNKAELDSMNMLITRIMSDTAMRIKRVVVTGICSPDGPWAYNEQLARKRVGNIGRYLRDYDLIPSALTETKYIAEDWEGLTRLVNESAMADKEAVLDVIRSVSNPEQREAALLRLPQYNYMRTNFYPQLRKVVCEVYYTTKESVDEAIPE